MQDSLVTWLLLLLLPLRLFQGLCPLLLLLLLPLEWAGHCHSTGA